MNREAEARHHPANQKGTGRQNCSVCAELGETRRSIPSIKKRHGKCQYHWDKGQHGYTAEMWLKIVAHVRTQHTPGPWTIDDTRIVGATGDTVIDCLGAMGGDNTQADKDLIAAAPELLAVLIDAVESLKRLPDRPGAYRQTCIAQAQRIIAKARGDT